jgi:biopolymer transport protein ExbD
VNFRGKQKVEAPTFQLAPMIDVVFLLLCFFIASQIFSQWETEIGIVLPTSVSGDPPDRLPGEIIINIRPAGDVVINDQEFNDDDLHKLLKRVSRLFKGQPVLIRADRLTAYEHIIHVLDLCRESDIGNISFATIQAEEG